MLQVLTTYAVSYLLGIAISVLFTPAELVLAGVALWPWYPALAVIGVFWFYVHLSPQYSLGAGFTHWMVFSIGLVPIAFEVGAYFRRESWLRVWRPVWIGFPVGFVGTVGVYYAAAASI